MAGVDEIHCTYLKPVPVSWLFIPVLLSNFAKAFLVMVLPRAAATP